jgi:hypothetical protein
VLEGLTTAIIVDQERMGADPRSTVGTATDANAMLRRPRREGDVQPDRRDVPALRGARQRLGLRPRRAVRREQVAQRGRADDPRLQHGWLVRPHLPRLRLLRPDKLLGRFNKRERLDLLYREPTKIKVDGINLTYAGLIPSIQKSFLSKDVDAMQPHVRLRRARGRVHHLSRLRRHAAGRGRPRVEDRRHEHRRRVRDADQRPGRVGARP